MCAHLGNKFHPEMVHFPPLVLKMIPFNNNNNFCNYPSVCKPSCLLYYYNYEGLKISHSLFGIKFQIPHLGAGSAAALHKSPNYWFKFPSSLLDL